MVEETTDQALGNTEIHLPFTSIFAFSAPLKDPQVLELLMCTSFRDNEIVHGGNEDGWMRSSINSSVQNCSPADY